MVRMQVQFTPEQARRLHRTAERRGESIAQVVRDAVDRSVTDDPHAEAVARALAVVGMFDSGLTDLSERHDDYLAEDFA